MVYVLPIAALILPGILAYAMCRVAGRAWPGLVMASLAVLAAVWLLSGLQDARPDDGAAVNRLLAAAMVALPAALSALSGTFFARRRPSSR